ncbi:MAG: hypothetical protein R2704_01690 [Microthrixaceae bacterium]
MVVATLLLAGCSGDGDAPTGDPATPDAELTYDSPLAEALNLGDAPDLATKQQEQVAECMADRGWDYTPVAIPGGIEDELGSLDAYAALFDEEYRTKWGYGISTIYTADGGYADGAPDGAAILTEDPNEAYADSLSPEEQSRYYTDLLGAGVAEELAVPADDGAGPTIPGDAAGADVPGDPTSGDPNVGGASDLDTGEGTDLEGDLEQLEGSCTLAGLNAEGSDELNRLEQLSARLDTAAADLGIDSTEALVEESSELQAAQRGWAECMGESGYDVEAVDDPTRVISERLDQVLFGAAADPEPDLGGVTSVPSGDAAPDATAPDATASEPPPDEDETADPTDDPGESEVVAGGGESGSEQATSRAQAFDPTDVDVAALKKLQTDELEMAEADRDCQAEFFRPVYVEARTEAEQRFVDRNAELLDELSQLAGPA